MDFSAIGGNPIFWCSFCGKEANQILKILQNALETRPGFAEELSSAIDKAQAETKRTAN
jgi:hypothetical protein